MKLTIFIRFNENLFIEVFSFSVIVNYTIVYFLLNKNNRRERGIEGIGGIGYSSLLSKYTISEVSLFHNRNLPFLHRYTNTSVNPFPLYPPVPSPILFTDFGMKTPLNEFSFSAILFSHSIVKQYERL